MGKLEKSTDTETQSTKERKCSTSMHVVLEGSILSVEETVDNVVKLLRNNDLLVSYRMELNTKMTYLTSKKD